MGFRWTPSGFVGDGHLLFEIGGFSSTNDPNPPLGLENVAGSVALVEDPDVFASSGSTTTSSAALTDSDDAIASTGATDPSGSAALADAADVVASSGSTTTGAAAFTETGDSVTAVGATDPAGSASLTDAGDVVASAGATGPLGSSATTDAADVAASSGSTDPTSAASITEDNDVIAAIGTAGTGESVSGSGAFVEAGDTIAAIAHDSPTPPNTFFVSGYDTGPIGVLGLSAAAVAQCSGVFTASVAVTGYRQALYISGYA